MARIKSKPKQYQSILRTYMGLNRWNWTYRYDGHLSNKVLLGQKVPILDLLFTQHRNFLITNNGQKVLRDYLEGKTILVYMLSLIEHKPKALLRETADIIEAYNELRALQGFEVVFVLKRRGDTLSRECAEKRFCHLFSRMPWLTIPFHDEETRDLIEQTFCSKEIGHELPYWAIINPMGRVLLIRSHKLRNFFSLYSGTELFPLTDLRLVRLLFYHHKYNVDEILNLDRLLGTHTRDFLLSKNGKKVPISSLKDKVVGLYFCDNVPNPPRMKLIKKVYQEALELGYNFEIVQITFHFYNNVKYFLYAEDRPLEPCHTRVPWLRLPFKDPCVKSLRRLFNLYKNLNAWKGDSLVIIDSHTLDGAFVEYHGANIVKDFGIEAYPFTERTIFEMEEEIDEDVKLQTIFPPCGPPLIRPRSCGGCDRVPVSQLWGKRVLVVFATHSICKSSVFMSKLASKYISQCANDEDLEFEVVYVSYDTNPSEFDECIKEMPWLVQPYSWDFAQKWRCILFKNGVKESIVAFQANGNLLARRYFLRYDILEDYPFFSEEVEYVPYKKFDESNYYDYPFFN